MPLVVLMYILKQKFEERQIGSIYLWQQVLKDIEVNTPWQKLKKNLLLFLQLLSILFWVFALSDPYFYTRGEMYSNLVIVIDNTGSMNARWGEETRLEHAKQLAVETINHSGTRSNITLLTMGRSPKVEIGKTTDKGEVIRRLREITPGNSYGNINDSVSLIKAMVKQYEGSLGYKAVFYTDSSIDTIDLNAEVVSLASELQNVSLDYISFSDDNGKLTVLVRATNRSNMPLEREISLYDNDKVLDIRNVELPAGETATVYFEEISTDAPYIWAELTEKDDLEEDNQVYCVVKANKSSRVLLISASNVFIEKALSNINGLELYKTNPGEGIEEGYDLYIYDSAAPDVLPKSGSVLLLNPPGDNGIIRAGSELQGGIADIMTHPITKYMENANFTVSKLKSLEVPFWADVLINVDGNAAAVSGEYKGRKSAVIGFDLHNSDFALTTEYPIFVYNLTAFLIGIDTDGRTSYVCGDSIDLNPNPEVKEANIKDPGGEVHRLELEYPMLPFEKTGQFGIYELTQKTDEAEKVSSFAVNFPVESESVNNMQLIPFVQKASADGDALGGIRLQEWLLGLLLFAAAVEWVVYIRGY
jgi:hypothetical protein